MLKIFWWFGACLKLGLHWIRGILETLQFFSISLTLCIENFGVNYYGMHICGKYINADLISNKYSVIYRIQSHICMSIMLVMVMKLEEPSETIFHSFPLTLEQEYYYVQLKLVEKTSAWYISNSRPTWDRLQFFFSGMVCSTSFFFNCSPKIFKAKQYSNGKDTYITLTSILPLNIRSMENFDTMNTCAFRRVRMSTCPLSRV